MNVRSTLLAVASVAFVAALALGDSGKATASLTPHPHFNDGGTLSWSTKLADAQAAAKKADKLIFIEYGREN